MDLSNYYRAYEELVTSIDKAFSQISTNFSKEVNCRPGCADCCYALFDITIVEAMYINKKFKETYKDFEREEILDRANKADREIHRIKRQAFKDQKNGANDVEIIGKMAMERVKCPLLKDDNQCALYDFRPINCRVYGVPTETGGMSHICGRTAFEQGMSYPTIKMDKLYEYLYKISGEMVKSMNTRFTEMGTMLMPVSMALATNFDDDFLGIGAKNQEAQSK